LQKNTKSGHKLGDNKAFNKPFQPTGDKPDLVFNVGVIAPAAESHRSRVAARLGNGPS